MLTIQIPKTDVWNCFMGFSKIDSVRGFNVEYRFLMFFYCQEKWWPFPPTSWIFLSVYSNQQFSLSLLCILIHKCFKMWRQIMMMR